MFNLVVACLSFGSFFLGLFVVVVVVVAGGCSGDLGRGSGGGFGCYGSGGGFGGMEQVVDLDGVGHVVVVWWMNGGGYGLCGGGYRSCCDVG